MGFMVGAAMAVAQGVGQYNQSKAEAAAYQAQAQSDLQNASIVGRQREQVNTQNLSERRQLVARRNLIEGRNTAAMGAGGVDGSSGTAFDASKANEAMYRRDSETLRENLFNADHGLRQEIENYEASARANKSAAKKIKKAGRLNAILSTATSLYGLKKGAASAKSASSTTSKSLNITPGSMGNTSGSMAWAGLNPSAFPGFG
jgi:hypothetical protein